MMSLFLKRLNDFRWYDLRLVQREVNLVMNPKCVEYS